MNTLQQFHAVVNPQPEAWVSVHRDPDGVWVWRINRTAGRLDTTSREAFATFEDAAECATRIAECYGLPLAADVSLFAEMASPFYSGHEHEMEVA